MKRKLLAVIGMICAFSLAGCQGSSDSKASEENKVEISETSTEATTEATIGGTTEVNESLFHSDDDKIDELAKNTVVLGDNEEIEDQYWVANNFCYRVAVKYIDTPTGSYQHKKDYFLFTGRVIPPFEVDYVVGDTEGERKVYDACDFKVVLEDVTFDGYDDLLISLGHNGAQGAEVYCAYIFDSDKEEYVYTPSFEKIGNYRVDKIHHEVRGNVRVNAYNDCELRFRYNENEKTFYKLSDRYGQFVSFEGGKNEFTDMIDAPDEDKYSIVLNLDNDGENEAIVCVASGPEVQSADAEGCYFIDNVYFVDEKKESHLLDEIGEFYLSKHQYLFIGENNSYITINGEVGAEPMGYIFTVDNESMRNVTEPLRSFGKKYFSGYDEIVWEACDYSTFFPISEGMSLLEAGGMGLCEIPYYYKIVNGEIVPYEAEIKTIEEVKAIADFDDSKYKDKESVQYIYRENNELNVNYAELSKDIKPVLVDISADTYHLENGTWVLVRSDNGYYNEDSMKESNWDYLNQIN